MATFSANEINAIDRDVTGPTEQVQIMFPLRCLNRVLRARAPMMRALVMCAC